MRKMFYPQTVRINDKPIREEEFPGQKGGKQKFPVFRGVPSSLMRYWRSQARRASRIRLESGHVAVSDIQE